MERLIKVLAGAAIALALASGGDAPKKHNLEARVEARDGVEFLGTENKMISDALASVSAYDLNLDVHFIKHQEDEQTGGRTYSNLGSKQQDTEDFIASFGKEKYEQLKGKDVITLSGFEFYEKNIVSSSTSLWDSLYLKNPDAETLYQRAVLHELGHIVFNKISDKKLQDRLVDIDIESGAGKKDGMKHPAHTSYYTYFYCGFDEMSDELREKSASEQFADIFALTHMGKIDENVADKELGQKIKLVKESLQRYKK